MKIKVACFTAMLLLVAGPAEAQELDGAVDDAGTSVTDAQLDAPPDAVSVDDGSAAPDTGVTDAAVEVPPTGDGGALSDAARPDGAAGGDGGAHDGGGAPPSDAGPPPPINQFFNENPGCSLGGTPDAAVGTLLESGLVVLLFARRRRAGGRRER